MNSLNFAIGLALVISTSLVFAATISTIAPVENLAHAHHENHIREDILALADEEKAADQALVDLKSEPRSDVIRIIHEDLIAQPVHPSSLDLKAAVSLRAVELLPTLAGLAENSEGWEVEFTIVKIAQAASAMTRAEVAKSMEKRLGGYLPSMKQVVITDGLSDLGVVLSDKIFTEMIASADHQIRIAAVRNFLRLRKSLTIPMQIARFRAAFQLKPYQARLPAMEEFGRLDGPLRESLKASVPEGLCRAESRLDVKTVCEQMSGGRK